MGFIHNFAAGRLEAGGPRRVAAQADLPQGSTVTTVTAHVSDGIMGANNNATNMTVKLWRNPLTVNPSEEMVSMATTNAPGNITLTSSTITNPTIDNAADSYFVSVCGLRSLNFLFDVVVNYTHPA